MRDNPFILPPEWQYPAKVMLSWPHDLTDWAYMLDEVRICFRDIAMAIAPHAQVIVIAPDASQVKDYFKGCDIRLTVIETPTNDTWTRDYGMICTVDSNGSVKINDFKFNGWGLKFPADRDNLVTGNIAAAGLLSSDAEYVNRLNFVLEGGSVDIDEDAVLMTTSECLLSPNRNGALSRRQIENRLRSYLGCSRVLWVDHGALEGDDTDSHIDTLARFLPGGFIVCSSCDRSDDPHFSPLNAMISQISEFRTQSGTPYKIVELPIPMPIYDEDGMRLPATYANFLIVNNALIVPVYGDPHYDKLSTDRLKEALPDYQVETVDCRALIKQHGSLHCMTMQIPQNALII